MKNKIEVYGTTPDWLLKTIGRHCYFFSGAPSNNAAQKAEQDRLERESKRGANIGRINKTIDEGQEGRLKEVEQGVLDFFFPKRQDEEDRALRNIKFEVARRAGAGGSQELDAQKEFKRKDIEGREKIGTLALQAKDRALRNDESTRAKLISQANQDVGVESLVSSALREVQNNAQSSQNDAFTQGIGGIFDNSANLFSDVALVDGIGAGRNKAQRVISGGKGSTLDPSSFEGSIFNS